MQPFARRWIHLALAYFCVAVTLGCWMGATNQFTFAPLHAHLNLLGWVTMTLMGVIYHHFPGAAQHRLAQVHFWGYNLLLPVQMLALEQVLAGNANAGPVLGMASVGMVATILVFAFNVWRHGGAALNPTAAVAEGAAQRA